jgi:PDZ domain
MKKSGYLAIGVAAAALFAAASFGAAQSAGDSGSAQVPSQGSAPPPAPPIAGQGGEDSTLEIAPQPGARAPKPGVEEIPGGRTFRPGENTASIPPPAYAPGTENGEHGGSTARPHGKPYLGITVQYTTQCYLGMEEHGLEVLTVDPDSPAAQSGVQGRTAPNALGAAAATASSLVPLLNTLTDSVLSKHGDLGLGGDLIVAVDDHRIRSQQDLEDELARLKPGDTMYLTVIRPLYGGGHTTKKIAVTLGDLNRPLAAAGAPASSATTH